MATPGINCDRLREENPQRTQRGYASTELWECWCANADGTVNENGLVDPRTVIDDPGLPAMGSPHPIFPSALVIDKRVSQVVANWSVIVVVSFRGWGLYHGGPRAGVRAATDTCYVALPVWVKITDNAQVSYKEKPRSYPQKVSLRVETKFLGGNQFDAVQNAIAVNAGLFYTFNATLYRLSDRSSAVYDGTAFTRVEYVFERPAPIPAIAPDPGQAAWGNAVAIPALPSFYTYASIPKDPPIVNAVAPLEGNGASLPGF